MMVDITYIRIKERRKSLGMTQTELATKTGYTNKSSIATIESGRVDLSIEKVKDFAKALECSPSYLMGWSDDYNNDESRLADTVAESFKNDKLMSLIGKLSNLSDSQLDIIIAMVDQMK